MSAFPCTARLYIARRPGAEPDRLTCECTVMVPDGHIAHEGPHFAAGWWWRVGADSDGRPAVFLSAVELRR